MSREIKFRAWDKKQKKMLYGVSIGTIKVWDENAPLISHEFSYSEDCVFEQYTGLKDKNGKEIYEGDIVLFFTEHFDKTTGGFDGEVEHNATVEWFNNGFAFMDKVSYDPNIECEVIGNVHENPELLQKYEELDK